MGNIVVYCYKICENAGGSTVIRENQRLLNQVNMLLDGVIAAASLLIGYWLRFCVLDGKPAVPFQYYLITAVAIAPLYVLAFAFWGLYDSQRRTHLSHALIKIIVLQGVLAGVMFVGFFILRMVDISRLALLFHVMVSTVLFFAKRVIVDKLLHYYRGKGYNQKKVILIGSGELAERYVAAINGYQELGFELLGYVSDTPSREGWVRLGGSDELEQVLDEHHCDEAVAALEAREFERMGAIIDACEKTGTKLGLVPFYTKYTTVRPEMDTIGNLPVINMRRIPLDNLGNAFLKRTVDIVGSIALIILTSPIMLFAAIGTKLSSPGPVIFKQERVGRKKKLFTMYKFRSMYVNGSQQTGWTTDADNRKTKFGALMRKASIDELPQFFNVLRGDMSLVGPRPEVPFFVDQFKKDVPLYMVKHQVRPGITGWAQVNGFRGDTSIKGRVEYDIFYIENWSMAFDIRILFMTVFGGMWNTEKLKT